MVYPDKILALIDNVQSAFSKARTIEQAEAARDHFHVLEGYIERTWPHERATIDTLRRLKSGLSIHHTRPAGAAVATQQLGRRYKHAAQ